MPTREASGATGGSASKARRTASSKPKEGHAKPQPKEGTAKPKARHVKTASTNLQGGSQPTARVKTRTSIKTLSTKFQGGSQPTRNKTWTVMKKPSTQLHGSSEQALFHSPANHAKQYIMVLCNGCGHAFQYDSFQGEMVFTTCPRCE